MVNVPRLVIAAPSSGSGKTTVAAGLMAAFASRGTAVSPHKVGPDYIDPGYHALATGRPGRNLDAYLCGPEQIVPLFLHGAAGADLAVIEGVMGLYDGASGQGELASTAHVAKLLRAPVVLVVDASAQARSVAALVHGFASWDPEIRLAAVILNNVASDRHEALLREALDGSGVPVLGALRRTGALHTPSRHLGLIPAAERHADALTLVDAVAAHVRQGCDLDALMALARSAGPLGAVPWSPTDALYAARAHRTGSAGPGGRGPHSPHTPPPGSARTPSVADPDGARDDAPAPAHAMPSAASTTRPDRPGSEAPVGAGGEAPIAAHGTTAAAAATRAAGARGTAPVSGRGGTGENTPLPTDSAHTSPTTGARTGPRDEAPLPAHGTTAAAAATRAAGARGTAPVSGRGGTGESTAPHPATRQSREQPVIAVAGGPAFTFGYAEHTELLRAAGAHVVTFDPLRDEALPPHTRGLVIGGGFPEMHAPQLAANEPLRAAVAAFDGPIAAECAGLLYLARELDGVPMCGVLDASARMTDRLTLGYREAVALQDNVLAAAGTRVRGHEFHRTTLDPPTGSGTEGGSGPAWGMVRPVRRTEGFVRGEVHASYLHVHWAAVPELALRFTERCAA